MIRVRLRVRYMSRNEKLYVNHVKQLKGEVKLLTSTKLSCAGMTKLTLLRDQCEEQTLVQLSLMQTKECF